MSKRPRIVSVYAANYPDIFAQILEKTKSVQVSKVLTTATSVAKTAVMARSLVQNYVPHEVRHYISDEFRRRFVLDFSSQLTITIEEYEGYVRNEVFEAAKAYLATKISPSNKKIKVSKHAKEKTYDVTVERDEEVVDTFNGVQFRWVLRCRHVESNKVRSEVRSFQLNFPKKFKDIALESYLPFIVKRATLMKQEKKKLKIFTLDRGWYSGTWSSVTLDHPSTFKTLAMDSDVKRSVMEDLDKFVKRSDYYKRVGKAWKRGYLLYGPPGTGKSSLIAAMANYLNFDIYDLELTAVRDNCELRQLLIATANRSIIIVEDIDCSLKLNNRTADESDDEEEAPVKSRKKKVTLSGLLNFIDGLWSSCGEERIIIFTPNYKEKLDPALLRPGRMDMHIHMSYCTPSAFKVLASNYLEIQEHPLFTKVEEYIEAIEVTPADVAEQLMRNNDSVDKILEGLVEFLEAKKIKMEQDKAKKEQDKAKKEEQELEEQLAKDKETKNKKKDSVVKKKRKG
ncbi:PREDICTED: protein HYPER-SENSITIVITY-RELATED 4-like [Camelina sativa]|uniref:Protein HYPER-SENSITIVITY-RELATED 4-like n=1 Tax=Camelina sativa TaxID=90675 RepID=A0ABM0THU3_CAMSA|nr:PREDICTED: protein HYPER-SENSITIVITY-RELATED 4-like [Camelina sativa]